LKVEGGRLQPDPISAYTEQQESNVGWFRRLGLKAKFLLITSLIVLAICGSLFFFAERILRTYLRSEMQEQASEIAQNLQDQLANFYNPVFVQDTADRLLHERPELSRITVYRRTGNTMQLFIQSTTTELPGHTDLYKTAVTRRFPFRYEFSYRNNEFWEFAYPILDGGEVQGLTAVTLNFSQYKRLLSALRRGSLLILITGLVVMLIGMGLYIGIIVHRPLAEIVRAMEKVKHANFDTRAKVHALDEIGKVAQYFNAMTLSLGEANEEVRRQNRILDQRVREATSELLARNLELYQAQDEIRRTSRLATAGQVAAMLAHDLGSPLSSISGHLQLMLEDENKTEQDRDRLQLLLNQVERLSDTIRNFLNNVSTPTLQIQDCDLNALLRHLIQLVTPLLRERNIESNLDLDESIPVLKADPHQLQQVFLNLFSNAVDAMREGGTLRVTTHRSEMAVETTVGDTGAGISPEHLKNLFQPFFSTKEFGKGTGLGLAICREIIHAHAGEITAESEEGAGTVFRIVLPITADVGLVKTGF
jgi:two-component system NtrC family sensor kinase